MPLHPQPIGHVIPLVLPRDAHDARAGHLVALPHALGQAVEENPQFLLFPLVGPLLSPQQPFADRGRDRDHPPDHPPDVAEPEGFIAEVQVSVTALIPVTIAGQVVDEDITDIALLLCLGHPVPKRPIVVIEEF